MAEHVLTLNQQIALLPAAIPDSVLDLLEDFQFPSSLQTEASRAAFDPDFLKAGGDSLKAQLDQLRLELGSLKLLNVSQAGREIPGGFCVHLTFEKGSCGLGLITKLKERTILRVFVQQGEYSETSLKELLKNPPKQG